MKTEFKSLHYVTKSKFVRSIFLPIVSIFLIAVIAIVLVVFFSFTSEINKSIIADRQQQLDVIEKTISQRMSEAASIGYNIVADTSFYTSPVEGVENTGYEMYRTLERYLVGNDFIQYLAFYRRSEPETIYTSKGTLTFHDFWQSYLDFDEYSEEEYLDYITSCSNTQLLPMNTSSDKETAYFTYCYALPQFTTEPQAYILMYIPQSELETLLQTQISDCSGIAGILDQNGNTIYQTSTLSEVGELNLNGLDRVNGVSYISINREKYIVQESISSYNGWTYVSIIRHGDMISSVASKQRIFILLLFILMAVVLFAMFACIIVQYKPISKLPWNIMIWKAEKKMATLLMREVY